MAKGILGDRSKCDKIKEGGKVTDDKEDVANVINEDTCAGGGGGGGSGLVHPYQHKSFDST